MKLFKKLRRLLSTKGNKLIGQLEDKIECLNYEFDNINKAYKKANDELINIQAEKRRLISVKDKTEDIISQLDKATKRAINEGKEDLAQHSFVLMESNKEKLNIFNKNIELIDQVENKLQKQLIIFANKINEIKLKIDTLKIKNSFATSINKINENLNIELNIDTTEITKIEEEIDKEYYVAEIKAENLENQAEVEYGNIINNSKFEEYKKSVMEG